MSFGESIATCLRKYATFRGRASRPEFWWFYLFGFVLSLVAEIVDAALHHTFVLQLIVNLALLLPSLAVTFRRLHDTGRSGWWLFIFLIPLIGIVTLIVFLCQESREGGARFEAATA